MLDKLEESEGTMVQPGFFSSAAGTIASAFAAGQRLVGADSTEFEKLATLQNDIEKGLNRIIVADIPAAFAASGPKLQFFQSQAAGAEQQLGTNFLILRDYLVDLIDDDFDDDEIFNSSEGAQELIERIDKFFGPRPNGVRLDGASLDLSAVTDALNNAQGIAAQGAVNLQNAGLGLLGRGQELFGQAQNAAPGIFNSGVNNLQGLLQQGQTAAGNFTGLLQDRLQGVR